MHDLLFANQDHLQPKHLRQYAEQIGLDMVRYDAEWGDEVYLQRIREHIESGIRSNLKSTPGFFLNGIIIDVSYGLRSLFEATAAVIRQI